MDQWFDALQDNQKYLGQGYLILGIIWSMNFDMVLALEMKQARINMSTV